MKAAIRSAKPAARDFPLSLEMHYKIRGDAGEQPGEGRTLWISSRTLIFEPDRPLSSGTDLEITIPWPVRLDERIGLQLWIRARVAHTLSQGVTAEIRKYQFRTRGAVYAAAAGQSASASAGVLTAQA
jgi:hypothetical protein